MSSTSNIAPFYIGQEVVCIGNFNKSIKDEPDISYPKKNITYTVRDCEFDCGWYIKLKEISNPIRTYRDNSGNIGDDEASFSATKFAPITSQFKTIEYSKVLEKEKQLIGVN
jgi:hypothetical protein